MQPNRYSLFGTFPIVGYVPADKAARLGAVTPIPILEMPLADQRQWCQAALDWLDGKTPRHGCPTADLCADGSCRRSPRHGPCLLLLPGEHPDWQDARRYRFDPGCNAITPRERRADPSPRPPLGLDQLHPPLVRDRFLDAWRRQEQTIAAELDSLRDQGYPIAVDAAAVLAAELAGGTVDLETGEVERGG